MLSRRAPRALRYALRRALRRRLWRAGRAGSSANRTRGILLRVMFASMALYLALSLAVARARPTVAMLARSEAGNFVIREINAIIEDEIGRGGLDYGKLVALEKDSAGRVTALVTNMALINSVCARITGGITKRALNTTSTGASIPLGNVIGGMLLSGRGPEVPIKIQSITNVRARFVNDFSDAGINQTRHTLSLIISAHIDILVPGNETQTDVTTRVAVAETIIVGTVPRVYTIH